MSDLPVANFEPAELHSSNPTRVERAAARVRVIDEVVAYGLAHPEARTQIDDLIAALPEPRLRVAIEQAIARGLPASRVMAQTGCDYATFRAVFDAQADST